MTDYFFLGCVHHQSSQQLCWTLNDCTCSPNRQNRNVIFWLIVCELKESQITSGSMKNVLEYSLFKLHTNAGPHPKEKCWFITKTNVGKMSPVYPLCSFQAGMLLKLTIGLSPGVGQLKVFLPMGCHYFIDTSDVFLIYNYTAIANQL